MFFIINEFSKEQLLLFYEILSSAPAKQQYFFTFVEIKKMKKNTRTLLWFTAITATLTLVVYITREQKNKIKLTRISDEGYEIAQDILYPDKLKESRKLRYGPVLPE